MTKTSPEILDTTKEEFEISELKKEYDIEVSEKELEVFKNMKFNVKEIESLKNWTETVTKLWLTKLWLELNTSNSQENATTSVWNSKAVSTLKNKTWDIKDAVEKWWFVAFVEEMKNSDNPLLKFLWSFLWFFVSIFGFWKKVEDVKDKVKEKLVSKEKREETINKINQNSDKISEELSQRLFKNEKVHPLVKTKIGKLIWNKDIFTDEILSTLSRKIDSWEEISLETISEVLKGKNEWKLLWEELIKDKELKEAIYLQFEKNLSDRITEEYWFELNLEKKQELSKIIKKHFNEQTSLVKLWESFWNWDKIYAYETFWAFFDSWKQAMNFQFDLIFSGIIWIWNLAINIFGSWVKMVKLWLSWFWIEWDLTLENFLEEIESMDEWKKAILLWIMYRKTSIAWRIAWSLIWKITEVATEIVSPTSIWFIESTKNMIWNVDSQLSSYQKLHFKLAGVEDEFLNTVKNQLKNVSTKTEIAKILDSSKDTKEIKIALSKIKWDLFDKDMIKNISSKIENLEDISSIRDTIATETKFNTKSLSFSEKIKNLYPGQMNYAEELSSKLGHISKWQTQRIKFGWSIEKYTKMPTAIKAAFAQKDISFSTDKLIFNSKDPKKVLELSGHLKKWAIESADNFRWMFWWIAEIALVWLAIWTSKEDESNLEVIIETLWYSTWIFWPWAMLLSVNWYRDPKTKEIKWWNVWQWVAWSVLLTMDLYETAKILASWWTMKDVLIKVVARPITATWNLLVHSYKFWKNWTAFSKKFLQEVSKWNVNISKIWNEVIKVFKTSGRKIGLLLALWTAWYLINESRYDISDEIEEMQKKWILDKNWNIKNKESIQKYLQEEFSNAEKETFVKLYLSQNEFVDIIWNTNIELDWNNINLEIKDKNLWKWIISPEQNKYLEDLWMKINFEYKKTA